MSDFPYLDCFNCNNHIDDPERCESCVRIGIGRPCNFTPYQPRRNEGLTNDERKYIKYDIAMTRKVSDSMDFNNFYVNFAGKTYKPTCAEIEQTADDYPIVKLECEISPRNCVTDHINKVRRNVINSFYGVTNWGEFIKNNYVGITIKNVIFNPPATIVFWEDDTKTVVKTQNDEVFDPEKGITMAIAKKLYGNKGSYFNEIKKWAEKYEDPRSEILNKKFNFPVFDNAWKAFFERHSLDEVAEKLNEVVNPPRGKFE